MALCGRPSGNELPRFAVVGSRLQRTSCVGGTDVGVDVFVGVGGMGVLVGSGAGASAAVVHATSKSKESDTIKTAFTVSSLRGT